MPSSPHRTSSQVSWPASQAILRALPAQVALLDGSGRVVEVNEAWRHFARINGWSDPNAGVGSSYLAECDAAAGESESDGHAAGAGIRAVLAGIEPRFELEYSCHGPAVKRWYCISVTPTDGGSGGAVVMHMDITERRAAEEAMRASQERYRLLSEQLHDTLENMPDGFFTLDREWRITNVNRATERLVGASREDFIGQDLWKLFPREEATYRPHYQRALDEQQPVEFEAWSPLLGIWTDVRAFPTRGGLGIYVRDVTGRRRIQEELRSSEERFSRIAEVTADGIWDWDLESDTVWRSPGVERLFGVAATMTDTTPWAERLHPQDRSSVLDGMYAAIHGTAGHWSSEYRFRRVDGRYAWVSDRASIVRRGDGYATRMVGGMSDITEQKLAQERLLEQAQLLDKARDAIHVRDLDHRVQYLNRSAEALYGWSAGEAIGRSMQALLHRDPAAFRRANDVLMSEGEWTGEMEVEANNGQRLAVEARWTLLRDPQGVPRRILAIDTDVTERRELERQVLRSQRLDSIGTLAGGIAHDLNNVFTPILMAADLLEGTGKNEEDATLLEAIRTSAHRGVDMVGRLLSFARGAEGARAPVRLQGVVEGVAKIIAETFPKNIVVDTQLAADLPPVMGDATQLHQVLLNLCVNARDAMPGGGVLSMRAALAPPDPAAQVDCMVIEVEDTGSGITPAHLERLWDPFFTTKPPGQGTGLGLPSSLAIVKGHGGMIRVRSEPGAGARFSVFLPVAKGAVASPPAGIEGEIPRGEGRCVLVVDDETAIRQVARRALEAHGYRVSTATDGVDAVAQFREARGAFDLVLVDMVMPVMDGAAAIEALRSLDPAVRIVATSGYAAPDRMAKVSASGVEQFLPKPYTREALLRSVAQGLRA